MLSRSDARLLHALRRRKARETEGLFLAEGVRSVEELAGSAIDLKFAVVSTTLGDSPRGHALQSRLAARAPLHVVDVHALNAAAATEQPQGVLAVARIPATTLADVQLAPRTVVLIADGVQDPGNLGTLIRIADAFAAAAVLLLPGSVDAWNPKVVRAAAGSSFHLPVLAQPHDALADWLGENNFRTLGADAGAAQLDRSYTEARTALVVGNEGAGVREETRALLDGTIGITMPGRAESLNVAVAAGILMYELTRSAA